MKSGVKFLLCLAIALAFAIFYQSGFKISDILTWPEFYRNWLRVMFIIIIIALLINSILNYNDE